MYITIYSVVDSIVNIKFLTVIFGVVVPVTIINGSIVHIRTSENIFTDNFYLVTNSIFEY